MKEQIERAFKPLIGLALWGAGRAADLESFQFGPRRQVTDRHGRTREVGTFALHVQCAWRVVGPSGIIVGSRDRYYPSQASGLDPLDPEFKWDKPGMNLCDERLGRFFDGHQAEPLHVEAIQADEAGSVQVVLGNYMLEVFPDHSQSDEHWRLFQPYTDSLPFVLTGLGIEA
jgi:hypothetical protein